MLFPESLRDERWDICWGCMLDLVLMLRREGGLVSRLQEGRRSVLQLNSPMPLLPDFESAP